MMYVYSGECRLCDVGVYSGFSDAAGIPLSTGDIVLTYTENEMGCRFVGGLSVVVSDQYTTFSGGRHEIKNGDVEFFVMGVRGVDLINAPGEWKVHLVKSHEDVINGEHWKDYGFSFRAD
jgi:hypothetical protein